MKLAAASATDQGLVRSNNEDAFLIDDQRALFAVADGMGGHRGGEVASHTAIEALRAAIANGIAAARRDHARQHRGARPGRGRRRAHGMGTTLTAVIAVGGRQLLIGHVGDSRAYLLHDGDTAPRHRRPQPGRGARARGPAHARTGRSASATRDRDPRARRRRPRRRRPLHARRRGRRPDRALLRRAHHDGARARHRTPRPHRTRPATPRRRARRRRERPPAARTTSPSS